ncbi:hypothetical protein [Nocardioides sp. YIM 152315]|uniref:hypothetical protein n=1 Tax=Nocardioides sp. YIM 152315 TaxID=3031760 RepID=UPI0023DBC65A|nr:hypothetical protein [Nocardioides sp. YIM 152315]MDF1606087.1 hypothetical protein [Nocardioides sp. YIM 152315]
MSRVRRVGVVLPGLVLVVTVVELVVAAVAPADQFAGKGWGVRLVVYPTLMLLPPAVWWLTTGRRDRTATVPCVAFTLLMLPFLSDTTANWLDLFREVGWWDDVSHVAHWALLGAGLALLLEPHVRPRWVLVPVVAGTGAILALAWELGEYWLFIRHGKEADGAYRDTLGDQVLGTSGALVAALLVAWWAAREDERTLTG